MNDPVLITVPTEIAHQLVDVAGVYQPVVIGPTTVDTVPLWVNPVILTGLTTAEGATNLGLSGTGAVRVAEWVNQDLLVDPSQFSEMLDGVGRYALDLHGVGSAGAAAAALVALPDPARPTERPRADDSEPVCPGQAASLAHLTPGQRRRIATARVELVEQRLVVARAGGALATEMVEQTRRWTQLSRLAPVVLWVGLGVSFLGSGAAFVLAFLEKINGAELALVVFVLAVVAVSPAVLLLLERPLRGLDTFSPGPAGDEG